MSCPIHPNVIHTGCDTCLPDLKRIAEEIRQGATVTTDPPIELIERIDALEAMVEQQTDRATEVLSQLADMTKSREEMRAARDESEKKRDLSAYVLDKALEQRDAEEKAAMCSGGILSDVCDVVFDDPRRAMTHGYDGVVQRCRELIAIERAIERCGSDAQVQINPSLKATYPEWWSAVAKMIEDYKAEEANR
jgi:hypothetical protein